MARKPRLILATLCLCTASSGSAEVSGEPPDCRVTIHMRDVVYDEALEQLNQRFGLAFVRVSDRYTIFLPPDATRMCADV